MSISTFRARRSDEFTNDNPILDAGEIGYERDTKKAKLGNGVESYSLLAYIGIGTSTGTTTAEGTSRTIVAADNGNTLDCSTAITLTFPAGLGVGFNCNIIPPNTGVVTLASAGGTLLNGATASLTRDTTNNVVSVVARAAVDSYKVTGV